MKELPQHQKDIRWLFAWAKAQALPMPDGDRATAFAERMAVMMFEAGLSEHAAREAAARSTLTASTHPQDSPP
ncbi:hypothetical protein SAMN02949497_2465 [Methylomagnum ishizawai]|uniref:Uncharacterized protein n=1 Tax=Methylomagnum ishizawai TaxID=1760988 RepID=A0A1Y6CWS4_9GAMM|nr:hypothetical protein [Methylomagnum ishizawai]SMF95119.1 hypothetical protein SAMN02949497_2465 [Methylomagnum ishizawai]